jgi:hypothetical protein
MVRHFAHHLDWLAPTAHSTRLKRQSYTEKAQRLNVRVRFS